MKLISFSASYIILLGISILLNIICPFLKIYWYFAFSIKQMRENHQYWRLFTNFLVKPTKKVNVGTLLDIIYLYANLYKLEEIAKLLLDYATFIMTILILCGLNIISTILLYYFFNIKESRTLINELSYSLMALNSYKEPDGKTYIWFIAIKNKFAPLGIIIMRIIINKDIYFDLIKTPLIGFINGFIFAILAYKFNINFTPNFLKKLLNGDVTKKVLHFDITDKGCSFHYEDTNIYNDTIHIQFNDTRRPYNPYNYEDNRQNYPEHYEELIKNINKSQKYNYNNIGNIEKSEEKEKDFLEEEEREENESIKNETDKNTFEENKEKKEKENINKEKEKIEEEYKIKYEEERKENIKRELKDKNKINEIKEEEKVNQINEDNENNLNKNHYKID